MLGDFFGRTSTCITMPGGEPLTFSPEPFDGFLPFSGAGNGATIGGLTLVALPDGTGEFRPTTINGQPVSGVGFRTLLELSDLNPNVPNTPIALVVVDQDGFAPVPDAFTQVQDAVSASVPTSALFDLAAQQAEFAGESGGGTFSSADTPVTVTAGSPVAETEETAVNEATQFDVTLPFTVTFGDQLFTPASIKMIVPSPSAGDVVGRVRLQDNNSPIPRDRIYFDYSFFHNVPFTPTGVSVNRFSPGFEKTFWDGIGSIDVRAPMAATFSTDVVADGATAVDKYEFGNIAVSTKLLLVSTERLAIAAGMGVSLPTADDLRISMMDGTELVTVNNDSVHLLPYVAAIYANEKSYVQSFLTFDFDTNGSGVDANTSGSGLERIGTWNDQHLVSLSTGYGRWLFINSDPYARLQRLTATAELHYTQTMNDSDVVSSGIYQVGTANDNLSLVNATIGGHMTLHTTTLTAGYTVPLSDEDRVFDGEFRFFINRGF
ncbi:MAG: hypothetical protein AAGJ46_13775 [Planctomycetota bacterium]